MINVKMISRQIYEKIQELPKALWVQMYSDRMQILNHVEQIEHTILPVQKYDHPRLVIGDFDAAMNTLTQLIKMKKLPWYDQNPILLLQIQECFDGGISNIEKRILSEMSYNAGARQVFLFDHKGQWLNIDVHTNRQDKFISKSISNATLIIVILLILAAFKYMS